MSSIWERAVRGDPDRHRIFIAVPLAPAVREAAAQARAPLAAYADQLRWVSPRHLHLTLQFLGDITTAGVTAAVEAARATAAADSPFAITFAGLGAFPSPAAPRVVWVGVARGAERLTVLAESLARALRDRGLSVDSRPFAPHLTLARVRGTGRPPDLRREAETFDRVVLGDQPVTELVVVKSVLGPSEPDHTVVATAPVGSGARNSEVL
ncbi:MAG TPA: RNA 2',3'-cyclic phosphodiesterase [bacterium]|nr:RNA 2',3'-cyclic phosphodiesterase [bacterium]